MSYLERFREKNPDLDDIPDEAIIEYLPKINPSRFGGLQGDDLKYAATNDDWAVTKGLKAGVDQLQATGGGLVGLAGDAVGSNKMRDWGLETYQSNIEEARKYEPDARFTDIDSAGDAMNWAGYTIGNLAPMMGTSLGAGSIGGLVAKKGVKEAAEKLVKDKMKAGLSREAAAKEAGEAMGRRVLAGQGAGAFAGSTGPETGFIYGDTEDAGVSALHGMVAGSFDALPIARVLNKFGLARQAKDQVTRSVTREIAKQGTFEGGTEGLQELTAQHAEHWVETNGETLLSDLGSANWEQIVEGVAAGALGGSVMGGGAGLLTRDPAPKKEGQEPQETGDQIQQRYKSQIEELRRSYAEAKQQGDNEAADAIAQKGKALREEYVAARKAVDPQFYGDLDPLAEADQKVQQAGEEVRARGGDALDAEMAKTEAATEEIPKATSESQVIGGMPDFESTERPDRDLTAADLGVQFPESDAAGAEEATASDLGIQFPGDNQPRNARERMPLDQPRDMTGIDGLITIADRMGFADERARLQTAKRLYASADRLQQEGNEEQAAKRRQRADEMYDKIVGESESLQGYADQFPVPYQFQGEVMGGEVGPSLRQGFTMPDNAEMEGRAQRTPTNRIRSNPRAKIGSEGMVYGERPPREFTPEPNEYEGVGQNVVNRMAEQPAGIEATPGVQARQYSAADLRPDAIWTGKRGDGYPSAQAAEKGRQRRAKQEPNLEWQVEQMSSGRFQVAGYEPGRSQAEASPSLAPASPSQAEANVRGAPIDSEWTAFTPESGTQNVPRADMPQVKAEHRGALANFLRARGVEGTEKTVPAASLKPTQAEFSEAKVQKAKEFEGGDRAILVSSDGHILDGHHQWMARRDEGEEVRVIEMNAPVQQLLQEAREFPSSTRAAGTERPGSEGEAGRPPEQTDIESASQAPGSQQPIEDFGEKIAGARKDYAQKLEDASQKEVANVPLSESWPEPDYQKMIDDGADARAVALVRTLRDEVPNKPRKKWKVAGWAKQVQTLRDAAMRILEDPDYASRFREGAGENRILEPVPLKAELYEAVGHGKSLKGIRFGKVRYSMLNGEKFEGGKEFYEVSKAAKATAFSNMPMTLARSETKNEAIEQFKKVHKTLDDATSKAAKKVRFDIYSYRDGDTPFFIAKKIGRDVVPIREGFASAAEAREHMASNQAELEETLAKLKEVPAHRKETNAPRVGSDHRNGGDVSPEQFSDAFGFRGVQFGNYVEQGRRQQDLNRTYDALMDLAGILNLPPKALSLNGELGLAFGARGKGGKNAPAAHYEPGQIVINLTKREGAGSLAHEWFHGLDNYFSRMKGRSAGMMTEDRGATSASRGGRFYDDGRVRPEMVEAFAELKRSIRRTAMQQRSKQLDRVRSKNYWTTEPEMAARAFESYIIEKLESQGASNDYLANIVSESYWESLAARGMRKEGSYPYPEAAEMPAIRAGFDHFFQTVETRETDSGIALFAFAGEQSETADTQTLAAAREMAAAGQSNEAIRQKTGWFRGDDGKWRYEVSDDQAGLVDRFPDDETPWREVYEEELPRALDGRGRSIVVSDILDHPQLFAAYPKIANIPVGLKDGSGASYSRPSDTEMEFIRIGEDVPMSEVTSTLLHEIQHGIQNIEGFARGGSPKMFQAEHQQLSQQVRELNEQMREANRSGNSDRYADLMGEREGIVSRILELEGTFGIVGEGQYRRLAGEVEARNVQSRRNMADWERDLLPPDETRDVAPEDVIVTFNGVEMENAPSPANLDNTPATRRNRAPVSEAQARQIIDRISGDWLGNNRPALVETFDDLPASIKRQARDQNAEGKVKGAFQGDRLYVVRDKHTTARDLEETVFHEAYGHLGFSKMFGQDIVREMNKLFMGIGGNRGLNELAQKHGINMSAYARAGAKKQQSGKWTAEQRHRMMTEELLAHLAEDNRPGIRRRAREIIGAIKQMLRKRGFNVLGKVSDNELFALLRRAREAVQTDAEPGTGTTLVMDRETEAQFQNRPENDEAGSPLFRTEQTTTDYERRIDQIFEGAPRNRQGVKVLDRADILGLLGHGEGPLRLVESAVGKKRRDGSVAHPGMTAEQWKRLPDWIENPAAAFDSDSVSGRITLIAPELVGGKPVVIVLNPNSQIGGLDAHVLVNAYEKDQPGRVPVQRWVKEGQLLYLDQKRSPEISERSGLRLPRDVRQLRGYNHRVATEKDLVNYRSERGDSGPGDPNIMFRRAIEEGREQQTRAIRSGIRDRLDGLRFQMQDKLIDLKRAQEGIDVEDEANPYQKAAIWEGKAGERLSDFDEEHVQPLLEKVAKTGLTVEEVGEWLVARHAREANEYLAEINPDKPADERYRLSGMSNEEAVKILADRAGNAALREVGERVDRINRQRVDMLVDEGLIDREEAAAWQARYKHYVPLKREEADGSQYLPSRGQGFQVKGRESKQRTGSAHWTPSKILTNTLAQMESSIIRAEKMQVGRALLSFVEQNPDPSFWSIDTERKTRTVRDGKVVEGAKLWDAPNEMTVKRDGKEHVIVFNPNNKRAMRLVTGMKNLQAAEMGSVMRGLSSVTRFLASLNTSWNPEFMVSNFARDVQTAAYNLSDTDIADMRGRVMKDIPSAMNGIRSALFGDGSAQWAKTWEDFRQHGGKTGWLDIHSDLNDHETNVTKAVERLRKGKTSKSNVARFMKSVENANNVIENAVRLSAYKHALDAGLSKDRAAALAKDLTVNFNRKGNWGPTANALYMFYNAAVQGNVRLLQAMANSKKGRRLAYGTIGFAAMLDMINRSLAGDDDDGENLYDTLPDYVKNHNIIFMGEEEPLVKIPAPWGYNVLHTLGQVMGEAVTSDRFNPLEAGSRVASSIVNAFNPVGAGTVLQMFSPTVLDPIAQMAENKNFAGNPLKPEHTYDAQRPKPEYRMHFSTVKQSSKAVAEWLNDATGGNEVRPGRINISPESIDVILDTITGGLGRTATNSIDTASRLIAGEEVPRDNIPFVRKVTGYSNDYGLKGRYYEWGRDVAYTKKEIRDLRGEERREALQRPQRRLIGLHDSVEKQLRNLREARRRLENSEAPEERIDAIDKRIRQAMARFNRRYAEVMLE